MMMPAIELTKSTLRAVKVEDLGIIQTLAAVPGVASRLLDATPALLENLTCMEGFTPFVVEVGGEVAGCLAVEQGIDVFRKNATISGFIAEDYWNRGIYKEARRALEGWAFEHLDIERIHASVFDGNPAIVHVLEQLGYRFEARLKSRIFKDGHMLDELIFSLMKGER